MEFFGGNPFHTVVGGKIETATDASLASENWALNMEICDIINDTEDAARDAVKAIRKRLQQNVGKNYTVVMYSLTVLETCVKNCGRKFHLLATNKEFVQELVKLIGPKNDPPTAVQEKVLSLIQSWADAFKGNPEMLGVVQVYQDLKQKGVEFPMTDLDALAPIHTPSRSVPESEVPRPSPPSVRPPPDGSASIPITPVPPSLPSFPVNLSPEQLGKLRSELDVVQGNINVFSEMLSELNPGQEHPSDLDLLKELYKTLKNMQTRIVELVDKIASEEVTVELLRVNDELNNIFLRYSRFEKNRVGPQDRQSPQTHADIHKTVVSAPLIDLGDVVSAPTESQDLTSQLSGMTLGARSVSSTLSQMNTVPAQSAEDEFDMFAQSRNATYETSKQSGSSYADNINVSDQSDLGLGAAALNKSGALKKSEDDEEGSFDETLQRESDLKEMEDWLHEKAVADQQQQQSITSTEFDKFLAERAAAVEGAPSPPNSVPTAGGGSTGASRAAPRRQLGKDEQENPLFAL